ncbi:MAG TPA: tetraacyldisaccharide 4'-kinase [Stellaceae bacterium]|jgi:tetraacyldisaccharide 4'-kinase|nr:tetraacyldisaccharide 4'-kinase [Stellaceae bacterium]
MRSPEFWREKPGLVAGLLAPVGAAWDAAGRLRRAVTRPYRAPVPVVCVGNLVAGGSGKTPVALSLAAMLPGAHAVTRGYGGSLDGPVRVMPSHPAAEIGDEALLLAARLPCWVAKDRAAGIRAAVAAGAEAILLDDGFQNPTVAKDLSLVVVDAGFGFGNRRVIPAGPLRERIAPGLARADAIVLVGDGPAPEGLAARPVLRADLAPVGGGEFAGMPVVAFAGIGRPEKFFATLRGVGAVIAASREFPDHHQFRPTELAALRDEAARHGAALVTTAKDWARLGPAERAGIAVLEVEIAWRDPAALAALLAPVIRDAAARPD